MSRPRAFDRITFWVLSGGLMLAVVALSIRPLTNPDTFFHLRYGHEFLTDWSLRHPGSVSTFATREWVPTQWSTQIVMAQLESWFGLRGVALWSGIQLLTFACAVLWVCRREASPLVAALMTALTLGASIGWLSARPTVLSFTLSAIFAGAWLSTARDGRPRWWLIPLTWVWATAHGMWPVGVALGFVSVVAIALDGTVPGRQLARLASVATGSAVAAALTPVGPSLYSAVLLVSGRGRYFAEWGPARFFDIHQIAFLIMLVAALLLALRQRDRLTWHECAVLMSALGWALYSGRTVAASAAILAPLLARLLQRVLGEYAAPRLREASSLLIGGVVALAAIAVLSTPSRISPQQPDWLIKTLRTQPPGTKVLDDWSWGGYLMWEYPHLDLMMHGYGDSFTTAELDRNLRLLKVEPGWDTDVTESGARLAILPPESPLTYALRNQLHWRLLRANGDVALLQAP